jgi:hypothetical protein
VSRRLYQRHSADDNRAYQCEDQAKASHDYPL